MTVERLMVTSSEYLESQGKGEGHASAGCFLERTPDIVEITSPSNSVILSEMDGTSGPKDSERPYVYKKSADGTVQSVHDREGAVDETCRGSLYSLKWLSA